MRQTLHLDSDQIVALHDPPAAMQDEVARDPYDMHRLVENRLYLSALLAVIRSEEHTSELQSLMRISYAVFCLKKKNTQISTPLIDTLNTTKTYLYLNINL